MMPSSHFSTIHKQDIIDVKVKVIPGALGVYFPRG